MNSLKTNRFDVFVNRAARDKCVFAKFYQPRLMDNPELHLILALIASLQCYCLAICLSVSFYLVTAKMIGGQVPYKLTRIWLQFSTATSTSLATILVVCAHSAENVLLHIVSPQCLS